MSPIDPASSCQPPSSGFCTTWGHRKRWAGDSPFFLLSRGCAGTATANEAWAGQGSALCPLCLAFCLYRLLDHCCPQHPASSAGVKQQQPLGCAMGAGAWLRSSDRLSQPTMERARLLCLQWFLGFSGAGTGFIQLSPRKLSFGAFPVVSRCLVPPGNGLAALQAWGHANVVMHQRIYQQCGVVIAGHVIKVPCLRHPDAF